MANEVCGFRAVAAVWGILCSRMRHPTTQRAIAVLCLMAFCLGQAVFGAFRVKCEDGSGVARFEAACLRTADGSCLTQCVPVSAAEADANSCHDEGEHAPHPCKDTPIGESFSAAKVLLRVKCTVPVAFEFAVALVAEQFVVDESACAADAVAPTQCVRPPGMVEQLRTIILLV